MRNVFVGARGALISIVFAIGFIGLGCGGDICLECLDGGSPVGDGSVVSDQASPPTGDLVAVPSCTDGIKNQDETAVDCGGSCASTLNQKCAVGEGCNGPSDCQSGICESGMCKAQITGTDCDLVTTGFCIRASSAARAACATGLIVVAWGPTCPGQFKECRSDPGKPLQVATDSSWSGYVRSSTICGASYTDWSSTTAGTKPATFDQYRISGQNRLSVTEVCSLPGDGKKPTTFMDGRDPC